MEMHNGDLGDNVSSPFAEIGVTEKQLVFREARLDEDECEWLV